jgi:hypothetical protein
LLRTSPLAGLEAARRAAHAAHAAARARHLLRKEHFENVHAGAAAAAAKARKAAAVAMAAAAEATKAPAPPTAAPRLLLARRRVKVLAVLEALVKARSLLRVGEDLVRL